MKKSTVDEIRARFEGEVERFSNLETGQSATMDAPLALELIASAAAVVTPGARAVLDVGCGAGNYTVKLLGKLPGLEVTLLDLSPAMLERAVGRVTVAGASAVRGVVGDVREVALGEAGFDVILASAVLHHLRSDREWEEVFAKFYRALRPGGAIWIFDLVEHASAGVQKMMWERYGEYLVGLHGEKYRDEVFGYIEKEDTPRSVGFQMEVMRRVGFAEVEVLHKNGPFAAFGGIKKD